MFNLRNRLKVCFLLLVLLAVAPQPALGYRLHSGWYFGLGGGGSKLEAGVFDDEEITGKVYGGYHLFPLGALEAGYVDLGTFESRTTSFTTKLKVTGFYADGVVVVPITSGFDLYGKGGVFQWEADRITGGSTVLSKRDADPTVGAGFSFFLSSNREIDYARSVDLEMRGEWERFRFANDDIDAFMVSLVGHFL